MQFCLRCRSINILSDSISDDCADCGFSRWWEDVGRQQHLNHSCDVGSYHIGWYGTEIFISKKGVGNVIHPNGSFLEYEPKEKPIFDQITFDITEEEIDRLLALWNLLQ